MSQNLSFLPMRICKKCNREFSIGFMLTMAQLTAKVNQLNLFGFEGPLIAAIQSDNNFCIFSIPHDVSYREWFDYPAGIASFTARQTERSDRV
ncbi:hypothetical protein, partial [Klebsiella grimontii]